MPAIVFSDETDFGGLLRPNRDRDTKEQAEFFKRTEDRFEGLFKNFRVEQEAKEQQFRGLMDRWKKDVDDANNETKGFLADIRKARQENMRLVEIAKKERLAAEKERLAKQIEVQELRDQTALLSRLLQRAIDNVWLAAKLLLAVVGLGILLLVVWGLIKSIPALLLRWKS